MEKGNIKLAFPFGTFLDQATSSFLQNSNAKIESSYFIKSQIKKHYDENEFYETEIGFNCKSMGMSIC